MLTTHNITHEDGRTLSFAQKIVRTKHGTGCSFPIILIKKSQIAKRVRETTLWNDLRIAVFRGLAKLQYSSFYVKYRQLYSMLTKTYSANSENNYFMVKQLQSHQ